MKKLIPLLLAALLAVTSHAAEQLPLFNAMLTIGKEQRFVLIGAAGKASEFLKLGAVFEGYTLKTYDAKTGTLELERDGKITKISQVADAAVGSGPAAMTASPATIADAQAMLNAMNFDEMMTKMLAGIGKSQKTMIDRMMGQMLPPNADPETRTAVVEFQKKIMDEMMSGLTAAGMKDDIAKAYSEVFTKEELQGLGAFYQSPLGKAFSDKQPELTEKMNAVMAPRMMAAMPKIQGMMRDFSMEQRAKRDAAKASAAPEQK